MSFDRIVRKPLQFEDMYGNVVDDWHAHTLDILMNGGGSELARYMDER